MIKNIPITKSVTMPIEGVKMIFDAFKENHRVTEVETTKREQIQAYKEVELAKIKGQREVLEQYFEGVFSERKLMINKMFDALDKGIETNNLELIQQSLGSVVAIAKESPLAGVKNLLSDFNNPDVKELTI